MAGNVMQIWAEAARKRVSVRDYSAALDKAAFYDLKSFTMTLCNDEARIDLRAKNGVLAKPPILSSVLGGVSGTNCFAAIIVKEGCEYMGGYIGEAFVLECTARGFGTCWLGATYKKSLVKQIVEIGEDEKLIAIISVGKCDRMPETAPRKSIEQLTGLSQEQFGRLPLWQQNAVKLARIAPSARNRQPWELEVKPDSIRIICNSSNFGYGDVDCGIAMLHLELGAAKNNVYGDWITDSYDRKFVPFSDESVAEPDDAQIIPDSELE